MGYFIGALLERKVEEYDLGDLHQKLASIADGSDTDWPAGGYGIPAIPAYLESTRIVLYSMLHYHGLKHRFTVKTNYSTFVIYIDQKGPAKRTSAAGAGTAAAKRTGSIFVSGDDTPGFSARRASLQDVPAVPEDLSDVFSEDLTLSRTGEES